MYLFEKKNVFICKAERNRTAVPCIHRSTPQRTQQLGLAEARSLQLQLCFPYGWQETIYLGCPPLLPQAE